MPILMAFHLISETLLTLLFGRYSITPKLQERTQFPHVTCVRELRQMYAVCFFMCIKQTLPVSVVF